jgi:quinoprotein relay system zinc metallohydrolase 2
MSQWMIGLVLILLSATQVGAEPITLTKVADGVYVHHGVHEDLAEGYHGDICNISFVVGGNGIAVIDTGGTFKVGERFHAAIRQVSDLPIKYVINTHVHPDHIYGNAAFLADKPEFVGHAKLAGAMERRAEPYRRTHEEWLGDDFKGSVIIKPTILVQDKVMLDLGDRQLMLTAYPIAHTNTDITVLDNKSGTFWTGDLLFVERIPSIDGDIKGWIKVTDDLAKFTVKQTIPGHGPVVQDLRSALGDQQRYLSTLLHDIRASIQKGEGMESAMNSAAATEKERWVLFDIVNRRNVNNIYPGLEWE